MSKATGLKAILLPLLLLTGCASDTAPKTSNFEHDHVVAPHWPNDLADAATKIRERLAWLQDGHTPESHDHDHEINPTAEIIDIVSWIPEIAADTNLAEADWLPIYQATESLASKLRSVHLQTSGDELTSDNRRQLETLCDLVDETVTKIPDQSSLLTKAKS